MLARRSQQASDFTKSDASFGGPAKMIPDEPSRPAAIPRHEVYHMVAAELVHEPNDEHTGGRIAWIHLETSLILSA